MPKERLRLTDPTPTSTTTESEGEERSLPLHVKYRPKVLQDVRGQSEVVKSISAMLKSLTRPHSFLFVGPSGCGKTTLARILADEFDCEGYNIIEIDAATNSGIDAMRAVTETLSYAGFGAKPNKMVIIDECHSLSQSAWQSLLKIVEEPPEHVYFAFCTTEEQKIPKTILTRVQRYALKEVRGDDIAELLVAVDDIEGLGTPDEVLKQVIRSAKGSPRQALVNLSLCVGLRTKEEAARILERADENVDVIELARLIAFRKGFTWQACSELLKRIKEQNPESVRIVIVNYLNACLFNAKSDREAQALLNSLDQFSGKVFNKDDKWAPILLAIGTLLFED